MNPNRETTLVECDLVTNNGPFANTDFVTSDPRTDGPAWKAAEAEGHDMSVVASLLRMSLTERFKTHGAALATVSMLRGATLENG